MISNRKVLEDAGRRCQNDTLMNAWVAKFRTNWIDVIKEVSTFEVTVILIPERTTNCPHK